MRTNKIRRSEYRKEYYQKNKIKMSERQKEYRLKNKDKLLRNRKEYHLKNRDKASEYYQANKDKVLERMKEYRLKNRDKILRNRKEYNLKNKDKLSQNSKERYQKEKEKILEIKKEYNCQKEKEKMKEYYQKNKDKMKEYYQKNKIKMSEYRKEYNLKNKIKLSENRKEYRLKNRDKILKRIKEHRLKNKDKMLERQKEYRLKNKDKLLINVKEYYQKNRDKIIAYNCKSRQKRLQTDMTFRLYCRTSTALHEYLKKVKQTKYSRTFNMLGYSSQNLMEHIEKQMKPNMNWQNYGNNGWHIEHKVPGSLFQKISTFTNCEQTKRMILRECWSLSNLTTMIGRENIVKSDILYANYRARYIQKIQDITQNSDNINYLQNNNPRLLEICMMIEKEALKE